MELQPLIDRLAAVPPTAMPFVSLYLDTRPDHTGRDRSRAFVRRELTARARTYPAHSPERASFDHDAARIDAWLDAEARPSANGIAIFACHALDDFFEAVQLPVPLETSELIVDRRPHVYPLARIADHYRRYAAVVTDTNTARIIVFGLGEVERTGRIENIKMTRSDQGGWSQARYQRHVDHFHRQHVKELVDVLDRVVRTERIDRLVLAGDEVVVPLIRSQLPKALAARVVDVVSLDVRAPEHAVLAETLRAIREQDAREDADLARRVLDAYRAGGLGVVGVEETRAALQNGQVHELVLSARPDRIRGERGEGGAAVADELVALARRTDARVTFLEDPVLLEEVGGVGGLLRYRVSEQSVTGRAA